MPREKTVTSEIIAFLEQYQRERKRIVRLRSELSQLRGLCEQITVDPTKEKIQSSGSKDKLGDTVARIVDKEAEVMEEVSRAFDALNEVEDAINSLDDPDEQLVLQMCYIEGRNLRYIESHLYMSERTAYRVKAHALEKLAEFGSKNSDILQNVKE